MPHVFAVVGLSILSIPLFWQDLKHKVKNEHGLRKGTDLQNTRLMARVWKTEVGQERICPASFFSLSMVAS